MEFLKDMKKGIGIMCGMILVLGILFGVYAFIEPTQGPNAGNNYINKLNPFTKDIGSLSANLGMYNNKILDRTFPLAYTEVCFKNGATYNDTHTAGQSTAGGNCLPGDTGYIIEQNERSAQIWSDAKITCTQNDMRIPESLEYQYGCNNAGTLGLTGMVTGWEWSSNTALPMYGGAGNGVGVHVMGSGGCTFAAWGWVGASAGYSGSNAFRCSR